MTTTITWTWLGDHLALDLANTVQESGGAMVDLLPDANGFASWREAVPHPLPPCPAPDPQDLANVRALRDDVLELLHAAVQGADLPQGAVARVNGTVRESSTTRHLVTVGQAVAVPASGSPFTRLRGVLAAAAVDLLARDDLTNLALCRAPGCGQFFHRSRPNQRWCSAGCGNRARVDRHRHRRATTVVDGR